MRANAAQGRKAQLEGLKVPASFPNVAIYFGSQTGTAEKYSQQLDEEAQALGIPSEVIDFDKFSPEVFEKHDLILVCQATHYEGDPPDNTKKFFKYIRSLLKEGAQTMKGKHFAVFGLGDSSYELFNEMGKHFDASFEKLGGIRAHELGAGNAETHSTEEDFHNWSAPLWEKLIAIYNEIAPSAE